LILFEAIVNGIVFGTEFLTSNRSLGLLFKNLLNSKSFN
jgi:hypothetical protein